MLAACGSDSKSGTGTLSFSMTDAPVDEAAAVIIAMTEFELKPADGAPFRVPVTFTCSASADDGVAETYPLEGVEFSAVIEVTIVSDETKQCDIPQDEAATGPC